MVASSYMRKSIRLKNKSNYFNPDKDKSHNTFGSPNSYQTKNIKIEGYENRLYYEFRWCDENDGATYFYTLTYNDNAVPQYNGMNCFDYEDLRYLLNGGFKKYLLRNYGTNFKYFVGAELGEGAGKRGFQNNPHYHILFFLRNANDARYPYVKITPLEFRHLVRLYWQGFDEDFGKQDYRTAKFGIAREGSENFGLVKDFRAVSYVAKYVTKDVNLKKYESFLDGDELKLFRNRFSNKCRISQGVGDYALEFINPDNPSVRVPSKKGWKERPLNMYYYRKLYTDVVKDAAGNPIRILNSRGIKYKLSRLDDNIKKMAVKTRAMVAAIDENLYNDVFYSHYNEKTSFNFTYDKFKKIINKKNIFTDYATYKLVYEDRFFTLAENGHDSCFPPINVHSDYARFIAPSYFTTSYSPSRLELFLEGDNEGYLSYSLHPRFVCNSSVFSMLDSVSDYLFAETDRQNQQKADEVEKVRKFQKRREFSRSINYL